MYGLLLIAERRKSSCILTEGMESDLDLRTYVHKSS